jgi:Tol biopolymer transport system component
VDPRLQTRRLQRARLLAVHLHRDDQDDIDGGGTTTIELGNFYDMRDPSFARQRDLAFAAHDQYNEEGIFGSRADASRRRRMPTGAGGGTWPTWSPDGRTIAFQCGYAVCVVDADGTHEHLLVAAPAERPAWSPNGREIIYACGKPAGAPSASKAGALCVVSLSDRSTRRVRLAWSG